MDPIPQGDITYSLLDIERSDYGVLITFGDGLTILFSGKRLRTCAFAHQPEPSLLVSQTRQPS